MLRRAGLQIGILVALPLLAHCASARYLVREAPNSAEALYEEAQCQLQCVVVPLSVCACVY